MEKENSPVPISILIPTRNEEKNLPLCLEAIYKWVDEIVIADSHSNDKTIEISESYGAKVIQFDNLQSWPKKRQWAIETYDFKNDWLLMLDADEILSDEGKKEIESAIYNTEYSGYSLVFKMEFLGKQIKRAHPGLEKLVLFRKGYGNYEKRLDNQDDTMSDIEANSHIIVNGKTKRLNTPVLHKNLNSLYHYIYKHNEYSNLDASVLYYGNKSDLKASLFGNQSQRRRWLRNNILFFPGSPLLYFLYLYFFKFGFLDGKPGLYFCTFQMIQFIHLKAKVYELTILNRK
jgi:glycosyltransferase involved in cell wall biosynthesis